jgi:hypothetical protein
VLLFQCLPVTGFSAVVKHISPLKQSPSQSHVMTDGQSVRLSWCRVPSGTAARCTFFYYYLPGVAYIEHVSNRIHSIT